jgi:hypothetical protein
MSTTVLFVEHLITGFQAAVWISLLVFSAFGYEWVDLNKYKDFTTLIGILVISFIYPIGVFVDNVSDELLKSWNRKIREKYIGDKTKSARKLLTITDDDAFAEYLGYVRTRIRISRSTFLNFLLITLTVVIFTATRLQVVCGSEFWKVIVFEIIVGFFITIFALANWHKISHTFAKQIARGFEIVSEKQAE